MVVVTVSQSMPLVIAFGFFFLIVGLVLLGSQLFGPGSWLNRLDQAAMRAQADAEQLRQRLRGAVPMAMQSHPPE